MCAVAAIPYIIMAVGTAYSMYTQNQQAHYAADVAKQNAKLDQQQAANAQAAGSYEADQARIRGRLLQGQQLAAFAANNVDNTTGSAADILGDTAMFTAQDMRQARTNAAMRAYGFQVDALNQKGSADYSLWSGRTQQTATLLQAASSAAGMASRGGMFGGGSQQSLTGGGNTLLTGGNYTGPQSTSIRWGGYGGGFQ